MTAIANQSAAAATLPTVRGWLFGLCVTGLMFVAPPAAGGQSTLDDRIRTCLWSDDAMEQDRACAAIRADASLATASRATLHQMEALLREGPAAGVDGLALRHDVEVALTDGRALSVIVELPSRYHQATTWPVLLAMHGGPPRTTEQAREGAERMLEAWSLPADDAGWIVAAPVMTTVVAREARTDDRLPYDVIRPIEIQAILAAIVPRFRIDPNRIVATGVSLGSNFSIALAAATPDRFAAIVPVSTEGESREWVLRQLAHVPVYVLEGTRDANIRAIEGPRTLQRILQSFAHDFVYREFGDRGHEGFEDHYPDVLRWLAGRARTVYPPTVLRLPHTGILPPARRQYWIEPDTRQGLVRARVEPGTNVIDITARWTRRVRLYLHDRLVDLDRPIVVRVNGIEVENRRVDRSVWQAIEGIRQRGDAGAVFSAALDVNVPEWEASVTEGRRLHASLEPRVPETTLSFWETYALRALDERFASLGFTGTAVADGQDPPLAGERIAIRVDTVDSGSPFAAAGLQPDDLLLEIDGEPFFENRDLEHLRQWLVRELTGTGREYPLLVWRDGRTQTLTATLQLAPVEEP